MKTSVKGQQPATCATTYNPVHWLLLAKLHLLKPLLPSVPVAPVWPGIAPPLWKGHPSQTWCLETLPLCPVFSSDTPGTPPQWLHGSVEEGSSETCLATYKQTPFHVLLLPCVWILASSPTPKTGSVMWLDLSLVPKPLPDFITQLWRKPWSFSTAAR